MGSSAAWRRADARNRCLTTAVPRVTHRELWKNAESRVKSTSIDAGLGGPWLSYISRLSARVSSNNADLTNEHADLGKGGYRLLGLVRDIGVRGNYGRGNDHSNKCQSNQQIVHWVLLLVRLLKPVHKTMMND